MQFAVGSPLNADSIIHEVRPIQDICGMLRGVAEELRELLLQGTKGQQRQYIHISDKHCAS